MKSKETNLCVFDVFTRSLIIMLWRAADWDEDSRKFRFCSDFNRKKCMWNCNYTFLRCEWRTGESQCEWEEAFSRPGGVWSHCLPGQRTIHCKSEYSLSNLQNNAHIQSFLLTHYVGLRFHHRSAPFHTYMVPVDWSLCLWYHVRVKKVNTIGLGSCETSIRTACSDSKNESADFKVGKFVYFCGIVVVVHS